jgi:hypothetical protein
MDAEISRIVGVVLERRRAASRWADHVWRVAEVLDGKADAEPFTRLALLADGTERYFAGNAEIVLHRTETEAYRANLSGDRKIYAALRPDESGRHPFSVHQVSASPDDACNLLDSGELLVEAVPMPQRILEWVAAFCDVHHKEKPFLKRRRDSVAIEELKFSKEPIFARTGRVPKLGRAND